MQQPGYKPPIPSAHEQMRHYGGPMVNSSGQGANAVVPPEIAVGFNWGAFLMNWLWGVNHAVWISLIALFVGFIPGIGSVASLAFCVYLGIKGNELAWRNRRFESVEQFREVQAAWTKWGIILLVASLVIGILGAILFFSLGGAAAMSGASQRGFRP